MGSEALEDMDSPCINELSKGCFNNCYNCSNPFSLSKNPTNHDFATARRDKFISATFSYLPPLNSDFTNNESLPSLTQSFSLFEKAYPKFSQTEKADEMRARNFSHLSLSNHVCLDYIGHGLFTGTPLAPSTSSSSNPPSDNISSTSFFDIVYKSVSLDSLLCNNQETEFESKIRKRIFGFMNMSQDDYFMVFMANKSSAFKLLAETYSFDSSPNLLTVYDHESEAVEMMVESAIKRGAINKNAEFSWPNLGILTKKLKYLVENKKKNKKNKGLFIFPPQSSLTGARYSYLWMSFARENGWNVLLDASALGAKDMETLGLSLFQPDFLFCSFYKVFGENPSGFGCLFIKKTSISALDESKNVGIVSLVPPQNSDLLEISNWYLPEHSDDNSEIQENVDPKMALEELEFKGLDCADSLGLVVITNRAKYLVNWLINALLRLKHPNSENGLPLVGIYGPKIENIRGPALAFNVFDWRGKRIDPELVQKLADRFNISLSCGFLKNIRFSDEYRGEMGKIVEKNSSMKGVTFLRINVLNASFGYLTNFQDVYRLWVFVSKFLDADFVEKERWRYKALNQKTIEI